LDSYQKKPWEFDIRLNSAAPVKQRSHLLGHRSLTRPALAQRLASGAAVKPRPLQAVVGHVRNTTRTNIPLLPTSQFPYHERASLWFKLAS